MLLNARSAFSEENHHTTILLGIEDITERRAKEREVKELLHQKDVLLQEMQHRVANSLQIIASILLLKARTVRSEETRLHLQDAHQQVMLVAAIQRHLHGSKPGATIALGPYLSHLCEALLQRCWRVGILREFGAKGFRFSCRERIMPFKILWDGG